MVDRDGLWVSQWNPWGSWYIKFCFVLVYWLPYSSHTSHHPSQTPYLPWISYATQKLSSIHERWSKSSRKHSIRFCGIFSSLKHNFIAYRSSKVSDCIFEIHQLWQTDFSRVYSNCCRSCWFKLEIIKIGLSSHKMYSNNIVNFQESTTILNASTKKNVESYWIHHVCQFCVDIRYCLEDLPGSMNDRDGLKERIRKICAVSAVWWWYQAFILATNNYQVDLFDT